MSVYRKMSTCCCCFPLDVGVWIMAYLEVRHTKIMVVAKVKRTHDLDTVKP